jgi:heme/copper-type cytochrome/quinol oxidase subunit 3
MSIIAPPSSSTTTAQPEATIALSPSSDAAIPPLKVAVWLVLSAELMLFSGLLGAYVVLRGGNPALFESHAQVLDRATALTGSLVMLISSVVVLRTVRASVEGWRERAVVGFGGAIALALAVLVTIAVQWNTLLDRATVVWTDPAGGVQYVYDGPAERRDHDGKLVVTGQRVVAAHLTNLDVHRVSDLQLRAAQRGGLDGWGKFPIDASAATVVSYGPWKNVFFSCFYLLTGAVAVHLLAGIGVAGVALARVGRGTISPVAAECAATYWHFVTLATVVTLLLLYWS